MKSLRFSTTLLIFLSLTAFGSTTFGDPPGKSVMVTNNTSYTLSGFFASPSDSDGWDTTNNLLAGNTVAPGQTTSIVIPDALAECTYDLMGVLFGAAQYAYQYQVNACGGGTWNISVSD